MTPYNVDKLYISLYVEMNDLIPQGEGERESYLIFSATDYYISSPACGPEA